MFKIGEFAQLGQVSVRTLRHYEELGLLRPLEIDPATGYRYYSASQLPRLNWILALKDLGLSLEQIGRLLKTNLTPAQLKAMLSLKQVEFEQELEDTRARLERLQTWLDYLGAAEMKQNDKTEFSLKTVESVQVAALRRTLPAYGYLGTAFGTLRDYLAEFGVNPRKPSLVIWHFSEDEEQSFEVEVAELVAENLPSSEKIRIYSLPRLDLAASAVHRGDFATAYQTYQALGQWVEENGYRVNGPVRQLHHEFNPQGDPASYITEFQLPVTKIRS